MEKVRFKMYKDGKMWVVMGMTTFALGASLASPVNLDLNSDNFGVMLKAHAMEFKSDPDSLPIQNFIKNDGTGLKVGNQVDPSYRVVQGNGTQLEYPTDTNGGSGKVLEVLLQKGAAGDGGIEISMPVYSNTNYTVEFYARNGDKLSDVGPLRYGIKGAGTGNYETWNRIDGTGYTRRELKFKSSNNAGDYQVNTQEKFVTAYIYRLFAADGNKNLDARVSYIKLIPNKPQIKTKANTFTVNLSAVKGKTRAEVLKMYDTQIQAFLKSSSTDTNNNDNPVLADLDTFNDNTVIQSVSDGFQAPYTAHKWGEKAVNDIIFEIRDDTPDERPYPTPAPTIEDIRPSDEKIGGTGRAGNHIQVKDSAGNVIGATTVDPDGNWSITIPDDAVLEVGSNKTTVTETTPDDKSASANGNVLPDPPTPTPTVDNAKPSDKNITGKGTPGNVIEVKDPRWKDNG